jgi:hypothetical protein
MSERYTEPGPIDADWIKEVEGHHFRTNHDTGANLNALFVWNILRRRAGLPSISKNDLPAFCIIHNTHHIIDEKNGCVREPEWRAEDGAIRIVK